jgi:hypothetical protein
MKLRWLLGLGLDGKDGHVRVTRGRNFSLLGGSRDTHDAMQEKAIKFNEELDRRQTTLERLSRGEFLDIAGKIGLHGDRPQTDNSQSAD